MDILELKKDVKNMSELTFEAAQLHLVDISKITRTYDTIMDMYMPTRLVVHTCASHTLKNQA